MIKSPVERILPYLVKKLLFKNLITLVICLALVGAGWALKTKATPRPKQSNAVAIPTQSIPVDLPPLPDSVSPSEATVAFLMGGIQRIAVLHTSRLDASAFDVSQYTVKEGDTIFDIAKKFNLKPSTILWANLATLADNPEMIYPQEVLNILPVDGVYYQWHEGDGLNRVSQVLHVEPGDIIDFPGNHLDDQNIGDYTHPNIKVGAWLIIPGGTREFISWSAPFLSRFHPEVAKLYGPGACETPTDGAVGTGSFTWPTVEHWLSGYNYTPGANHPAVDFAGSLGNAIYAADNGVIVYAGWNDWGYGNVTVIDHGNGYQTLYGHQSEIRVTCGQSVYKGQLIGLMGSTGHSSGPHLHFEMWFKSSHVNPHDYLPIETSGN